MTSAVQSSKMHKCRWKEGVGEVHRSLQWWSVFVEILVKFLSFQISFGCCWKIMLKLFCAVSCHSLLQIHSPPLYTALCASGGWFLRTASAGSASFPDFWFWFSQLKALTGGPRRGRGVCFIFISSGLQVVNNCAQLLYGSLLQLQLSWSSNYSPLLLLAQSGHSSWLCIISS